MNFCLKLFVGRRVERFIGAVRHSIIYMTSVQFEEKREGQANSYSKYHVNGNQPLVDYEMSQTEQSCLYV